jgi:hypothetical protein
VQRICKVRQKLEAPGPLDPTQSIVDIPPPPLVQPGLTTNPPLWLVATFDWLVDKEGAPTADSARGLPAGSTAGPSSFVRDFFGNGLTCPRGSRGAYRGVARGGSTLKGGAH